MSPEMLNDYLIVLNNNGVISCSLKTGNEELLVTFGVMSSIPSGFSNPEPGGWKAPNNLDNADILFRPDNEMIIRKDSNE